jgi:hypothetical protein
LKVAVAATRMLEKPFACFSTGKRLDGLFFNHWILDKQPSIG